MVDPRTHGHASDTDEDEVERAQTMLKFELL